MTTRRSFLGAVLALGAAPAIVRVDSLMRLVPPPRLVLWGDGVHDDTVALQALLNGGEVHRRDGATFMRQRDGSIFLPNGLFAVSSTIVMSTPTSIISNCWFTSPAAPILHLT